MQAATSDANSVADVALQDLIKNFRMKNFLDDDDDQSHQMREPQKTQVNARKVLETWARDAIAKERQALANDDAQAASLMHDAYVIISNIRDGMDLKLTTMLGAEEHMLGLAFREASEDSIQAIASVSLEAISSKLVAPHDLPDRRLPVVDIKYIVGTPNSRQKGTGRELVNSIIDWANEMGRWVTITPSSDKMAEYCASIGFQRIDPEGVDFTMVYNGIQTEDKGSRGFLLDLV